MTQYTIRGVPTSRIVDNGSSHRGWTAPDRLQTAHVRRGAGEVDVVRAADADRPVVPQQALDTTQVLVAQGGEEDALAVVARGRLQEDGRAVDRRQRRGLVEAGETAVVGEGGGEPEVVGVAHRPPDPVKFKEISVLARLELQTYWTSLLMH